MLFPNFSARFVKALESITCDSKGAGRSGGFSTWRTPTELSRSAGSRVDSPSLLSPSPPPAGAPFSVPFSFDSPPVSRAIFPFPRQPVVIFARPPYTTRCTSAPHYSALPVWRRSPIFSFFWIFLFVSLILPTWKIFIGSKENHVGMISFSFSSFFSWRHIFQFALQVTTIRLEYSKDPLSNFSNRTG